MVRAFAIAIATATSIAQSGALSRFPFLAFESPCRFSCQKGQTCALNCARKCRNRFYAIPPLLDKLKETPSLKLLVDFGVWFLRWIFLWIFAWIFSGHFPWKKQAGKNPHPRFSRELLPWDKPPSASGAFFVDFLGLLESPKRRERKYEDKNSTEPFCKTILPNTVEHRKFPQSVSENAPFCETALKCIFIFLCIFRFWPSSSEKPGGIKSTPKSMANF